MKKICIIGGGFYGAAVSLFLNSKNKYDITLLEKEPYLCKRASYRNQARVHNGYHYPRSFSTAYRSHYNFKSFCNKWDSFLSKEFTQYYAISKINSKINYGQYEKFCHRVGIPLKEAKPEIYKLFNTSLISKIYEVEEYSINLKLVGEEINKEINNSKIITYLNTLVIDIYKDGNDSIIVVSKNSNGEIVTNKYNIVLNCTYSNISKLDRSLTENKPIIKHEITELVLVDVPIDIKSIGITIMDGPFFSLVPFPSENCHSLSHVRYTPHYSWTDNIDKFPDYELINYVKNTRFSRMRKDSFRYIPLLRDLKYIKSLFEIKSVLNINESDDGRPIFFKENSNINGLYSILGAKIDNIYDVFEALNKLLM